MKKTVAIIGGGAAGLLLAAFLDETQFQVSIYEKNKTLGRKLLVAGKGGFNLTHAEDVASLKARYHPKGFLNSAIGHFTNNDLRTWLEQIGIPTFVGTSHRIFPIQGVKPIQVLNKIIEHLQARKVNFKFEHQWRGWNEDDELLFENGKIVKADIVVFALGGASWKVTGSNGRWLSYFEKQGIKTNLFRAANCAFGVSWPKALLSKYSGAPLKNIALRCKEKYQKGELVITDFGLEGNAIYALSVEIQNQISEQNVATVYLDFKPAFSVEKVHQKLAASAKNKSTILKEDLKLSNSQIAVLKSQLSKEAFLDNDTLAESIKALKLELTAAAPIDAAISTMGGICLEELDPSYMLKNKPMHYCIGEMLDWYAPTGGYLLQAAFSQGAFVGYKINNRLSMLKSQLKFDS